MKICVNCREYDRASTEIKKAIIKSVEMLYSRIRSYEEQNIEFNLIYNDDKIKYDKHGDFYTFKSQKNHLQIRILYAYMIIDDVPTILVADFFQKNRTSKDYISQFDEYNNIKPMDLYMTAKVIYSTDT